MERAFLFFSSFGEREHDACLDLICCVVERVDLGSRVMSVSVFLCYTALGSFFAAWVGHLMTMPIRAMSDCLLGQCADTVGVPSQSLSL